MAIGGGTGLPNVLQALKTLTKHITAIVTMADDGGSSGRLRRELGMLPPGDVRNCLVALADSSSPLAQIFQYRFGRESSLKDHSLGNLILAALADQTGDFPRAIDVISRLLRVQGQVLPATLEDVTLVASVKSSAFVTGQARIARTSSLEFVTLEPREVVAYPRAVKVIKQAELIIIGPGSLFTSIIPNLLIKGITKAILDSKARKIYICNVMNQRAETAGFTATEHLDAVLSHSSPELVDTILIADLSFYKDGLEEYEKKGYFPVLCNKKELEERGVKVVVADLAQDENLLQHDPTKLATVLEELITISSRGLWRFFQRCSMGPARRCRIPFGTNPGL